MAIGDDVRRPRGESAARTSAADEAPHRPAGAPSKSEQARVAILDAALACIVEYGWEGANMSVICRRARITRGRMQYYFPTMDDLAQASIDYLNSEWRDRYFATLEEIVRTSDRFEAGIDAVWRLVRDPLHLAKQALEAKARTSPELDALMQQSVHAHEQASLDATRRIYPALASLGDQQFNLTRNFVMVFMEGLSLYRFDGEAGPQRDALIALLKTMLIDYWRAQGASTLNGGGPVAPPPAAAPAPSRDHAGVRRAIDLIRQAADILAQTD
jgi:AcrR family transcriptional regulator